MDKDLARKLNITLRASLVERMDAYAVNNGMSRSGLISIAVTQYLNAVEAMPSFNKLLNAMAAVSDGVLRGEVTPEEANVRLASIKATYDELSKKA